MKARKISFSIVAVVLCLGTLSLAWAQMSRMPGRGFGQRNPLMALQRAIQKSGAPALTSDQQTQLQTLIQNFRSAQQSAGTNSGLLTARQNFENAILGGNANNATAAADALASAGASNNQKRLEALAAFEVQALGILQPQASALRQELGNSGFVALLGSLAGGPGIRAGMGAGMGR